MGIIADIKAIKDVSRMKSGGIAKLSISQITCLITNMSDARKNLSRTEFKAIYAFYKELRKCNTKMEMDIYGYIETAIKIIKKFDETAPYEKYSGGNELESSFMMEDIRRMPSASDFSYMQNIEDVVSDKEYLKYADYIVENSYGAIDQDDAHKILKVIYCYYKYGKADALRKFDIMAKELIKKDSQKAIFKIGYMSGILYPNGVLTKEESNELTQKYANELIEMLKRSMKKSAD